MARKEGDMEEKRKLPEREQITLRIPTELIEQLRGTAEERGYTVNDLILFIQQPTAPE